MANRYLTTKDLCEIYQVSRIAIYKWRKEGMPTEIEGSRMVRFDAEKVDKWIKEHHRKS